MKLKPIKTEAKHEPVLPARYKLPKLGEATLSPVTADELARFPKLRKLCKLLQRIWQSAKNWKDGHVFLLSFIGGTFFGMFFVAWCCIIAWYVKHEFYDDPYENYRAFSVFEAYR